MAIIHDTLDLTAFGLMRGANMCVFLVNPWNRNTVRISKWHFERDGYHTNHDYFMISVEQARELYRRMVQSGYNTADIYDSVIEGINGEYANQFARMYEPGIVDFKALRKYEKELKYPFIHNIDIECHCS